MCGRCADDVCDAALRRRGEGQRKDRIRQALVYAGAGGCCLHARRDGIRRSAVARGGPFGRLSVLARVGAAFRPRRMAGQRGLGFARNALQVQLLAGECRGHARSGESVRAFQPRPDGQSLPVRGCRGQRGVRQRRGQRDLRQGIRDGERLVRRQGFRGGTPGCGIEFPAFGLRAAGRGGECRHALR